MSEKERARERERERERERAREEKSERRKKITEPKFKPTLSSLSGRRKPQTQGGTAPEGNPLFREQKKNAKICQLGLGMTHSNAGKKKKSGFRKGG